MNPPIDVHIRPAGPADAADMQALVEQAYHGYVARIGKPPAPMRDDYAAVVARGDSFVALVDAAIAGLVVLDDHDIDFVIETIGVHPAHQGRGIGAALMAFAERTALERGHTRSTLYTHVLMHENQIWYRHLGYREVDRRTEDGYDRVFMEKVLR